MVGNPTEVTATVDGSTVEVSWVDPVGLGEESILYEFAVDEAPDVPGGDAPYNSLSGSPWLALQVLDLDPGDHVVYMRVLEADEISDWVVSNEFTIEEPEPEPEPPSIDVTIGGTAYKIAAVDVGGDRIAQQVALSNFGDVLSVYVSNAQVGTILYNDGALTSTENPLPVVTHRAPEATTVEVEASDTPVEIFPANEHRHGIVFWNDSDTRCYILYGENTVTAYPLSADERYEPSQPSVTTGSLNVVWDAEATGTLHATELF